MWLYNRWYSDTETLKSNWKTKVACCAESLFFYMIPIKIEQQTPLKATFFCCQMLIVVSWLLLMGTSEALVCNNRVAAGEADGDNIVAESLPFCFVGDMGSTAICCCSPNPLPASSSSGRKLHCLSAGILGYPLAASSGPGFDKHAPEHGICWEFELGLGEANMFFLRFPFSFKCSNECDPSVTRNVSAPLGAIFPFCEFISVHTKAP